MRERVRWGGVLEDVDWVVDIVIEICIRKL